MFSELKALLASGELTMRIKNNDDQTMTVSLSAAAVSGTVLPPLVLTAPAEELDADFTNILSQYVVKRAGIAEQLEANLLVLAAVSEETKKKASSSTTSKKAQKAQAESDVEDEAENPDDQTSAAEAAKVAKAAPDDDELNLFSLEM